MTDVDTLNENDEAATAFTDVMVNFFYSTIMAFVQQICKSLYHVYQEFFRVDSLCYK
jgi:hypothetical protein